MPNLFLRLTTPVLSAGTGVSARVGSFATGFASARTLAAKNETLTRDNAALALENRALVDKVAGLVGLLGTESSAHGSIVAGVVARPPTSVYDTLVLSSGANAGVVAGMEVFGEGRTPLGSVTLVTSDFSRVTLFSSAGIETPAWVGSTHIAITLVGRGAGTFVATVPREVGDLSGQTVFLASDGAVPVGSVVRVGGAASEPASTLFIHSSISPFSIAWVTLRVGPGTLGTLAVCATSTPSARSGHFSP